MFNCRSLGHKKRFLISIEKIKIGLVLNNGLLSVQLIEASIALLVLCLASLNKICSF